MPHIAALYRHPVKSLGHQAMDRLTLIAGATIPYDREWALTHAKSAFDHDAPEWARCSVFLRVATNPCFAAVSAAYDEAAGALTLTHPAHPPLTVRPAEAEGEAALIAWAAKLTPSAAPAPVRLARVPGRGLTDSPFPSVSVQNLSSLRALSQKVGRELDPRRFRGNIWLDGLAPWEEFDWEGREISIGPARLRIVCPAPRCNATKANPETGLADTDTLGALEEGWGHTDFGMYAEVTAGGEIAFNDEVRA
jgi:uncharacterized protein YcbX